MIARGCMVRIKKEAEGGTAGKIMPVIMGGSELIVCSSGGLRFTVNVKDVAEVIPEFSLQAYAEFVASRLKSMDSLQENILHCAVGCSTESGELLSTAKKLWAYEKPLGDAEFDNLVEEAGDLLFYLVGLLNTLQLSIDLVAEANRLKLLRRYPEGYSNAAAIARADKGGLDAAD